MIKAVVFDLDGTITRPFLNFKRIRMEVGVPQDRQFLLDQIESLPEEARRRGLETLERHEREAAKNAELNQGVRELLAYVRAQGLGHAVVTRNSERSTRLVLERLEVSFDRVITRDSGLAVKPDPAPLFKLAEDWKIASADLLMVGDYRYDVACGKAAGAVTCFVTNGGGSGDRGGPDYTVSHPGEVIEVLKLAGHEPCPGAARGAAGESGG